MGDEHGISWPDGGMVASDSGMSYHSCNKPDYHHRVKQLEKGYDELRTICNRQKERIAELEAEVADLREELADIKDAHRRVMDEKCPTDEIHCTCSPALRSVIESLREHQRVLVEALKQLEWSGYDDYTQGNNCPICKAGSPQRWKHKKKCFIGAALAAKEG